MPLVQIKGISGYLSLQQKQEIISKVTDAIVSAIAPALLSHRDVVNAENAGANICPCKSSIEGEGLRPVTWVLIEDVAGPWGVGGQAVTTDAIRAMSQASG